MVEGFEKNINSKSKTFLAFCFCFIVGSAAASLFIFSSLVSVYLYFSIFPLIAVLILSWKHKLLRFGIICLGMLLLGVGRYALSIPDCSDPRQLCFYNGTVRTFVGVVDTEPSEKTNGVTYTVRAFSINDREREKPLGGLVRFDGRLYPAYSYGDLLQIKCRLNKPVATERSSFRFDKYLARYDIWSTCDFPTVKKNGSAGNPVMHKILTFKAALNNRVQKSWVEPEGSLMAGILYGARSGLPPELQNDFSKTGVSHIVAVSGFNITIIVVVLMNLLLFFGLYRQQAFYIIVGATIIFAVFTGLSASVIRAAVMGLTALLAKHIGRTANIGNVLVLTIAVMQLWNPYMLLWDAGFQLSFLATVGLVYISPVFEERFLNVKISGIIKNLIIEPLLTTLAAIVATLPLMLFEFGTLSFVAPLVNVLVLWLVPWLMLLGTVTLLASFLVAPLGAVAAFITHFGLAYVIMVVQFFGKQTWSSATLQIPLWLMLIMYGVLASALVRFYGSKKI